MEPPLAAAASQPSGIETSPSMLPVVAFNLYIPVDDVTHREPPTGIRCRGEFLSCTVTTTVLLEGSIRTTPASGVCVAQIQPPEAATPTALPRTLLLATTRFVSGSMRTMAPAPATQSPLGVTAMSSESVTGIVATTFPVSTSSRYISLQGHKLW